MKELYRPAEKSQDGELAPLSPKEKELWKSLEEADKPIVGVLKRINRILKYASLESGSDIETDSSCSGHAQEDGSISYEHIAPEFVGKVPKREIVPVIALAASKETTSPSQRKQVEQLLVDIFSRAITATNGKTGAESISLNNRTIPRPQDVYPIDSNKPVKTYVFILEFPLSQKENAYDVLKTFWNNVEKELSKIDGIQKITNTEIKDFFKKGPAPGMLRQK